MCELKDTTLDKDEMDIKIETAFYSALIFHKPLGINKHSNMMKIIRTVYDRHGFVLTSEKAWQYIKTLYNFEALENKQSLCPYLTLKEDYEGPGSEYPDVMEERKKVRSAEVEIVPAPKPIKEEPKKEVVPKEAIKKKEEPPPRPPPPVESSNTADDDSTSDSDEDDKDLKEIKKKKMLTKKPKGSKTPQRRVTRSIRDDQESSPASNSSKKVDDDEKVKLGRRSLRSRGDEKSTSTSPRAKRARRI